jgi:hypothetical protein
VRLGSIVFEGAGWGREQGYGTVAWGEGTLALWDTVAPHTEVLGAVHGMRGGGERGDIRVGYEPGAGAHEAGDGSGSISGDAAGILSGPVPLSAGPQDSATRCGSSPHYAAVSLCPGLVCPHA